jgi:hypothetical protein
VCRSAWRNAATCGMSEGLSPVAEQVMQIVGEMAGTEVSSVCSLAYFNPCTPSVLAAESVPVNRSQDTGACAPRRSSLANHLCASSPSPEFRCLRE